MLKYKSKGKPTATEIKEDSAIAIFFISLIILSLVAMIFHAVMS